MDNRTKTIQPTHFVINPRILRGARNFSRSMTNQDGSFERPTREICDGDPAEDFHLEIRDREKTTHAELELEMSVGLSVAANFFGASSSTQTYTHYTHTLLSSSLSGWIARESEASKRASEKKRGEDNFTASSQKPTYCESSDIPIYTHTARSIFPQTRATRDNGVCSGDGGGPARYTRTSSCDIYLYIHVCKRTNPIFFFSNPVPVFSFAFWVLCQESSRNRTTLFSFRDNGNVWYIFFSLSLRNIVSILQSIIGNRFRVRGALWNRLMWHARTAVCMSFDFSLT